MPGAAWRSAVNTCLCGLLLEKLDRHVTNREPGAENWYASITKVEAAFLVWKQVRGGKRDAPINTYRRPRIPPHALPPHVGH